MKIKKNNINITINLLKSVIRDENCGRMNLSTVKGYLGELIVKKKLENEGHHVEHRGNQSGYDLEFNNIRIDVKFSSLKSEIKDFPPYWGWALKQKSKKRSLSFTHFICVALNMNYEVGAFYVIRVDKLKKFSPGFKRFGNVERGFWVLPGRLPDSVKKDIKNPIINSKNLLRQGVVIKVKPTGNLSNVLK